MYSDKTNILQLASLMRAHGIKEVVLCPGSRNAPLSETFDSCPDFTCYTIVDERSAGFFSLGLSQALQRPVAVCCTSGSAVLNLSPAVAEAFYQRIPLLVITADRPTAWIGQMDGQTLPQMGAFGPMIKKAINLTEINDSEALWYNNRQINEAILALTHHGNGPVQINIPMSEPLFNFTVSVLKKERVIKQYRATQTILSEKLIQEWNQSPNVMIVVGQHAPSTAWSNVLGTLKQRGCVILHEHLSNYMEESKDMFLCSIPNFNEILYTLNKRGKQQIAGLIPDLVITCGGHIISKHLKTFLRKSRLRAHWHITPDGEVVDIFQSVTHIIEGDEIEVLQALAELPHEENNFKDLWMQFSNQTTRKSLQYTPHSFCAFQVMQKTLYGLPSGSALHLANSNTVRLAQLFILPYNIKVYCNRGVNGIEGSLSVATGFAAASTYLNFIIIGDLSFFYDMNVMRHASTTNNLRILLINNGGGEIFHLLPGLQQASALNNYIAAKHNITAQGWAKDTGFTYFQATDTKSFTKALPLFLSKNQPHPILLEVCTDSKKDEHTYTAYFKNLLKK
jgi:2-succinyl-5-enolpyruvyl-6-hydroxy-3-cyclohexene-1-carboxylate synthase